ncbi:hypothetical protein N7527_005102 [Penicillium freii]|nr:hypothetical protein N7527_005102 [Penicillium freii]
MQQKIGLVIVFCLGIVIVTAAIIRAVAITGKAYSDQAALAVWSIIESSIFSLWLLWRHAESLPSRLFCTWETSFRHRQLE